LRIIAVRHGETEENVAGIVQGQRQGALTEHGIEQSKAAAEVLRKVRVDAIYSSDLDRAAQTADYIAAYHGNKVEYAPELRERGYGIFQGRSRAEFFAVEPVGSNLRAAYRPDGGESFNDLLRRVGGFVHKLETGYGKGTVLLVTHGGIIKCLAVLYLGVPLDEVFAMKTVNAGVLMIDVNGSTGTLVKNTVLLSANDHNGLAWHGENQD
jgi:broad specificity phosphatase PhoE